MSMDLGAKAYQMKKLDEMAVSGGLEVGQMMELAAYHIAQYCIGRFHNKKIGIYAGSGNNGGDAIAVARFLLNAGVSCEIVLLKGEEELKDDGKHHLSLCKLLRVPVSFYGPDQGVDYDVILDGLLGYSLEGEPKSPYRECIEEINGSDAIIISVDIPSGFDANDGKALKPCIQADTTLFLAHSKFGYKKKENKKYFGECFLIDIGIPREIYRGAGLEYPFGQD